ncbi:MAG TPA: hypothetical protein PLJ78_03025 [Anaerolineae bacterium]|nr:hypothetical protein [Anaerolineae bacterium]HQK12900.1 hypothetical protein [Anaerolineae bacterium]
MHNLIPALNARENVETPMIGQVASPTKRRKRAEDLLARVRSPGRGRWRRAGVHRVGHPFEKPWHGWLLAVSARFKDCSIDGQQIKRI